MIFNREPAVSLIKKWLKIRPESQWLFCTITKEKKITERGCVTKPGSKLPRQFLTSMVKRYAKKAVIEKTVGFHTLRHTYATHLYLKTHDIEVVIQQLRHKSINTIKIYTQTA